MGLRRHRLPDGTAYTELDDIGKEGVAAVSKPGKRPEWLTRAMGSTMLSDFREEYKELEGFELLQRLTEVVGLRYHLDPSIAGIHTACLSCQPGDRPIYYAAIHRFEAARAQKKVIVCSYRDSSMKAALLNLVGVWFVVIRSEGEDGSSNAGGMFEVSDEQIEQLPAAQQDLTGLLQQSIDAVIKRKGPRP